MTQRGMEGKVVLVTGAARRVGAEIARTLHCAGACLLLHYRNAEGEARALRDELEARRSQSVVLVRDDLLDVSASARLVSEAIAHYGRLDALVNNASSFFATPLEDIAEAQWHDIVGTNLKAPLFLSQAAAPHLRRTGGAIVNIADIHAERPLARYLLYSTAKAGLVGLTRALALELAPQVRVNAVAPGPVMWPEDESFDAEARATIIGQTLLGRVGAPSDVARSVLFLLAEAPYVTGQILAVDGGRSVHL